MKRFILVIAMFILSVLQVTITWRFGIGWHNYGLFLTGVVILSLFDYPAGYIAAALSGFFLDCMLGMGCVYLCMGVITVFVLQIFSKMMYNRSLFTALVTTGILTFLWELIQYLLFFTAKGNGDIAFALTKLIFPQVFYNMLSAVFLYALFKYLYKVLKIDREGWNR